MAKIYNSELTKGLANNAGIQQSRDKTPDELAEKIVPVIETNPRLLRIMNFLGNAGSSTSGTTTIYTTPADKDFYLCHIVLSSTHDVNSDCVAVYASATPRGKATATLVEIPKQTLTATSNIQAVYFNPPLLLNRSSNITFTSTFAAGTTTRKAQIGGYEVENINI